MLDCVKIILTSSSITEQNILVAVSHAACAYAGVLKILWTLGPAYLGRGMANPLNSLLPACVTVPNSVILSKTVPA